MIDGVIDGKPRTLAQAQRNGHFPARPHERQAHPDRALHRLHQLDEEINKKGQPVGNPEKEASIPGALVSPTTDGATNWPPPSFNPDTGLFYVGTTRGVSMFYLTDTDPRPQGWAAAERHVGNLGTELKAIDYKTGKIVWSRPLAISIWGAEADRWASQHRGQASLRQRRRRNFVAYDAATGNPLWHAGLGNNTTNGPQTFLLDGRQYVVVGAAIAFAFTLRRRDAEGSARRGYRAGLSRPGSKR
jgi:alcohol dehydrogenase (cytochrome c)